MAEGRNITQAEPIIVLSLVSLPIAALGGIIVFIELSALLRLIVYLLIIILIILTLIFLYLGMVYRDRIQRHFSENVRIQKEREEERWFKEKAEFVPKKWRQIEELIKSNNTSDWKTAILLADSMIEEALKASGYPGETLGEIMKGIDKESLFSINDLWEAHKVRNRIAHDQSLTPISRQETIDTINKFKNSLREINLL